MFRRISKSCLVVTFLLSMILSVFANNSENAKIAELLTKMTIEEKIGQLAQMNGNSRATIEDLEEVIRQGGVGSFLNITDRDMKERLQKIAVEESRLGIPLIFGRDVIHGYKTVFPIPLGQTASWNPTLVEEAASVAAKEAVQNGIHWTFAPMMDISRDARWGRIAESNGEDPYLAARMAKAMTLGFQGNDPSAPDKIAACAKHYVGYGAAEGGRDYNTTLIPESELRNMYLPPFKASVDAGVLTIMSAFNDINGVPASGNAFTLRQILREEWGFDGTVVSDWNSMTEMINHGYCEDEREVALKSLKAGVDMEMVSESYQHHLKELIEAGEIDMALLDEAVANILRVKLRLNLFENPYPVKIDDSVILSDAHKKVATKLAAQSLVLLKNDSDVLPLKKNVKTIAIIGPLADSPKDQLGCWTPDGEEGPTETPLKAFQKNTKNINILYSKGMADARSKDTSLIDDAVQAAKKADVAILFVGEDYRISGEARCRAFIDLPGIQEELVEKVSATGTPVVMVIMAGRPLTFGSLIEKSQAILFAWHPGTMGGPAIYDVLMGKIVPSGKLPATFPRTVGQIPIYYNHRNTGRPPSNANLGIPLGTPEDPKGYTSNYLDADFTPQYPFGFGLSYTNFEYSDLKLSAKEINKEEKLAVTVDIKNSGKFDACEVVQLYIRDPFASLTRPVKELKGFKRVAIKAGEKQKVTFELTAKDLGFWNNENIFVTEAGDFKIMVGGSSADEDLLVENFKLLK